MFIYIKFHVNPHNLNLMFTCIKFHANPHKILWKMREINFIKFYEKYTKFYVHKYTSYRYVKFNVIKFNLCNLKVYQIYDIL